MKPEKHFQERENINEWFKRPKYRIWKYLGIGIGIAIIVLLTVGIIWMDSMSWRTVLVIRGCAGALAIIFCVLMLIYYYIVYKDYIRHRFDPKSKK